MVIFIYLRINEIGITLFSRQARTNKAITKCDRPQALLDATIANKGRLARDKIPL